MGLWLGKKKHIWKKKIRSQPGFAKSSESRVNPTVSMVFAHPDLLSYLDRSSNQIDHQAYPSLTTMVKTFFF